MNHKKLLFLFSVLFLFHLALSSFFYFIAVKGYFPSFCNRQGIWNYAIDSNSYHQEAIKGYNLLKQGMWKEWWESRYSPNWHVRWIALSYWLFRPFPLAMAPLNAFLWVGSFWLMFSLAFSLLNKRKLALTAALLFSFFPSNLADSIQLLKDPFYIFGVLLFLQGWIGIWRLGKDKSRQIFKALLLLISSGIGFYIIVNIRFYLLPAWLIIACLFYIFSLIYHPQRWFVSSMVFFVVLCVFISLRPFNLRELSKEIFRKAETQTAQQHEEIKQMPKRKAKISKYPWHYSSLIPDIIEHQLIKLSLYRKGYCTTPAKKGSNIDANIRFYSAADIIKYLPRAFSIGWLAPFPNFWFKKASIEKRVRRLATGAEMLIMYILYAGVLLTIFKSKEIGKPEMWMLILWSLFFIMPLALVVVNLGTLYRMRYIYLLPVFIYGIKGWGEWLNRKNNL